MTIRPSCNLWFLKQKALGASSSLYVSSDFGRLRTSSGIFGNDRVIFKNPSTGIGMTVIKCLWAHFLEWGVFTHLRPFMCVKLIIGVHGCFMAVTVRHKPSQAVTSHLGSSRSAPTRLRSSRSAKFFRGRVNASVAVTSCTQEVLSFILESPKRQNFFQSAILKGSLLSIFLAKESVCLAQWSKSLLLFFLDYSQPSTLSYFSSIVERTEGILREMDASTKWKTG